jgi:S-adenosylmethionine:tRNA ribosyltransferase-isomerase
VEYHAGFARPEPYEFLDDPPAAPVAAVGTTVVKALETYARTGERSGKSSLFICPPFEFKRVAAFLTNFHLPQETHVAMTATFAGLPMVKKAYAEAIERKYRWSDYGDSMLIL